MTEITMNSSKPYFFRAIYEWIEDNGLTTHIAVDTGIKGVDVPIQYINEGEIVLNISSSSIQMFENTNEMLSFEARFNGVLTPIFVPINAIKAVFARENQQGIFFEGHLVGEQFDLDDSSSDSVSGNALSSKAKKETDKNNNSLEPVEDKSPSKSKPIKKTKKRDGKSSHLKIIK